MTKSLIDTKALEKFWEEAKSWLGFFKARFDDIPGNHVTIGKQFLAKGQGWDAVQRFKLALWMRPKYEEAEAGLARAYAATGDLVRAKKTLAELRKHHPASILITEVEETINTASTPPSSTAESVAEAPQASTPSV